MGRTLSPCTVILLLTALATAPAAPTPDPTETVIRLEVTPMAAPRPALKYQLLPEVREMQPGQAVQNYLKCFMEQNFFFFHKDAEDRRERYLVMPLADLPVKEIRKEYGGNVGLKQADYAARLDTVDWQILPVIRRDGMNTLLPEVQQMRRLAAALKVRFRAEVAERRFDDAIRTAKTVFALGRAHGEHPTLIAGLVGVAISFMGVGPLEEMVGQPGCPNLYWALTNLPAPLVEFRKGVQGERFILGVDLAGLDDPAPKGAEELKRIVGNLKELFRYESPKVDAAGYVADKAGDAAHVKAARRRLLDAGLPAKDVAKYLPEQVVLVDEKLTFEAERDEVAKAVLLPHPEMERVLAGLSARKGDEGLFHRMVPATRKVKLAHTRLAQRLAMLRVVEALRLHAAEEGEFPPKLADVRVPLPADQFSGRAFEYKVEGGKAHLRGAVPAGYEKNGGFNVRYELTLRK
ncbi:MAG: hypothetical protein U0797_18860 [Gemmataceae bacterium]